MLRTSAIGDGRSGADGDGADGDGAGADGSGGVGERFGAVLGISVFRRGFGGGRAILRVRVRALRRRLRVGELAVPV